MAQSGRGLAWDQCRRRPRLGPVLQRAERLCVARWCPVNHATPDVVNSGGSFSGIGAAMRCTRVVDAKCDSLANHRASSSWTVTLLASELAWSTFPLAFVWPACVYLVSLQLKESKHGPLRDTSVVEAASSDRRCFLHCWLTAPVVLPSIFATSSGERPSPISLWSRARSLLVHWRSRRLLGLGPVLAAGATSTRCPSRQARFMLKSRRTFGSRELLLCCGESNGGGSLDAVLSRTFLTASVMAAVRSHSRFSCLE